MLHDAVLPLESIAYIPNLNDRETDHQISDLCNTSKTDRDALAIVESVAQLIPTDEADDDMPLRSKPQGFNAVSKFYFRHLPFPPSEIASLPAWLCNRSFACCSEKCIGFLRASGQLPFDN